MLINRIKGYDFLESLRTFLITPRKIYSVLPAMTIYALWRTAEAYSELIGVQSQLGGLSYLTRVAVTTVFAYAVTNVFSKRLMSSQPKLWLVKYVGVMAFCVLPIVAIWVATFQLSPRTIVVLFCRLTLLVSVTESIPGYLIGQIKVRASNLERHQEALIESEEQFRKVVADHLHDNLQTRLVTVGLQLDQLRSSSDVEQSDKILEVIAEIENIRSRDVRDFSRGISPQIEFDGLEASIRQLLNSYRGIISWEINGLENFSAEEQQDVTVSFGIYRIVEQALLNALVHGRASVFDVRASKYEGTSRINISNNGLIFHAHSVKQGHGFAVIDSWVSKLNGSWRIFDAEGTTTLHVEWKYPISHL